MKIEISHDALAKRLFERASTEDKMRLKVKTFIQDRYKDFTDPSRRTLLRVSDINYIEPYLKSLTTDLTADEHLFIRRSQNRKFWIRAMMGFSLFLAFAILFATLIQVNANKNKFELLSATLKHTKDSVEVTNTALQKAIKEEQELLAQLGIKSGDLDKTKDSLSRVTLQREQLIASLEESKRDLAVANAKLEAANAKLNQEKEQLKTEKEQLKTEKKQLETNNYQLKTEKMNFQTSQNLSQKAQDAYKKGNTSEAFKAAAEAWQLDNNSPAAIEVLRKINSDITGAPNWSVPPKQIIEQHATKYKFKLK